MLGNLFNMHNSLSLGISHSLFNFLDRFVELDLGSVAPLQATTV